MAQWQWQTTNGSTYLTCTLLDGWAHGFFTQTNWPRTPAALTQALAPEAQVFRVKQVHGNRVLKTADLEPVGPEQPVKAKSVQSPSAPSEAASAPAGNVTQSTTGQKFAEADGIFATEAAQAVWACSADCTPALLGDVKTGQAAAVHAGWRGTAAQILSEAVKQFVGQGSAIADLRVALGPAIDGSVYQVDAATAVKTAGMLVASDAEAAVLEQLMAMPHPPLLPDDEAGKVRLDVRRVNGLQLEGLGLATTQYSIAPHCTFQEPEHFFSYRRTGEKKVQWSGIVSR